MPAQISQNNLILAHDHAGHRDTDTPKSSCATGNCVFCLALASVGHQKVASVFPGGSGWVNNLSLWVMLIQTVACCSSVTQRSCSNNTMAPPSECSRNHILYKGDLPMTDALHSPGYKLCAMGSGLSGHTHSHDIGKLV